MIKCFFNLIRVKHYLKNLVVFSPYILYTNSFDLILIKQVFWAFICFCFVSSCVYVINDICDISNDKKHPLKKNGELVTGKISIYNALNILIFFLLLAVLFSVFINNWIRIILFLYLIINVLYSLFLKKKEIVSIICVALGFVLRSIAGFVALNISCDILFLLFIFIISIFFIVSKKKLNWGFNNETYYSENTLSFSLYLTSFSSFILYFLLILKSNLSWISCILFGFFIGRVLFISIRENTIKREFIMLFFEDKVLYLSLVILILELVFEISIKQLIF